ncbi:MAG: hypothetical protein LUC41_07940 [Clostridiales bacterium]|nr:hypothetical protein [Clostridiales bacterium]
MTYDITKQVERRKKKFYGLLSKLMIIFAIVFVVCGIIFQNGYFFPAILLALLYYFYTYNANLSFEYNFLQEYFTVDVIRGRRGRKTTQVVYYKDIEVVAPPDHDTVLKYKKKGGTEKVKKYDYTSYLEGIPYYTVIFTRDREKVKLLMDLDDEILHALKLKYPQKVYIS